MNRPLKCPGIGRVSDNAQALELYFSRPVTDEEMRFLHEVMQRACASLPTAGRPAFQPRVVQ